MKKFRDLSVKTKLIIMILGSVLFTAVVCISLAEWDGYDRGYRAGEKSLSKQLPLDDQLANIIETLKTASQDNIYYSVEITTRVWKDANPRYADVKIIINPK